MRQILVEPKKWKLAAAAKECHATLKGKGDASCWYYSDAGLLLVLFKVYFVQSLFCPKKGTMPRETHVQILSINVLVLGIARASSFESRLLKMVCPVLSHEGS